MSDAQVKPTNQEIAEYIYMWIETFDEDGLIITDGQLIKDELSKCNFEWLREMFAPEMYNSIDEWVKAQPERKEE